MPLTPAAANLKTAAIAEAFADIGHDETGMPKSRNNRDPIGWEVLVSKQLKALCASREAKAIKEAIKAGVMFDHMKNPDEAVIYGWFTTATWCASTLSLARAAPASITTNTWRVWWPRKSIRNCSRASRRTAPP